MNANFEELETILENVKEAGMQIRGITYEDQGCSSYQLQYTFRVVEFYLDKWELERTCRGKMDQPLSVYVKSKKGTGFYKIIN